MKKAILISLAAVAMLASCTGNKQKAADETTVEEQKSFEQAQIESYIKVQVDSLASEFSKMDFSSSLTRSLQEGRIILSEESKAVAPEYLIDPAVTNDLVTLSQKYRAVAVLSADKLIAEAYDKPVDEYDAALKKLVADIDDSAFKNLVDGDEAGKSHEELITAFYNDEDANGRINFFWETTTALLVEELYILSEDTNNEFISAFDDAAADNVTYRIALFQNALESLKEYCPEISQLCESIKPLQRLNAVSAEQFKQQVSEMHKDIKTIREDLLK
ncbi:MAG: hypothetical protein KBS99_04745 [Prevotellaceae bacterium]|nr:hypothetical protein [Candidatus Colivivens caballi]